jgi:hypothetical protein
MARGEGGNRNGLIVAGILVVALLIIIAQNNGDTRLNLVFFHVTWPLWVLLGGVGLIALVGFAKVPWDGLVHAWIQDVMVARPAPGVGRAVVAACRDAAREAGCEYLHVDFDDGLREFYYDACGFTPTSAGLIGRATG